ncbi:MAG: hypothetical protein C5S49_07490 [Candidatus Methanogaster sp.]|nr:MAG: hypothetical protein C5S49_07490 [ANME-2 cluster archaeon]
MNQIKTLFVVSLLLTCMYIPCIAAAGNNEYPRGYDAKVNKTIGQAQVANIRAGPAGAGMAADAQAMRRAGKGDLQRAREIYQDNRTPENQQMLMDVAKDNLLQMLDLMIERLKLLQEQIEFAEGDNVMVPVGASGNIDRSITRLESYKPEVQGADTEADVRSVARSINKEWISIRKEILHYTKYMIAVRIYTYIEKAGNISDLLDAKIDELDGGGVDTTNLRQNLDAFNEKLVCVEENYELAKDATPDDEISSKEVQQYIRNASRCIGEANQILRELFKELRALEYEIGVDESVSEEDEPTGDESTTVEAVNESDSETGAGEDGDADISGNETESGTDNGGVAS